jgi:hypothetical protein
MYVIFEGEDVVAADVVAGGRESQTRSRFYRILSVSFLPVFDPSDRGWFPVPPDLALWRQRLFQFNEGR